MSKPDDAINKPSIARDRQKYHIAHGLSDSISSLAKPQDSEVFALNK